MFVLLLKNGAINPTRDYFDKYCMPLVEIKDVSALIDDKPLCDQPMKNKQGVHEILVEMSSKNDYATGNLLDYLYHQFFFFF